MSTNEPRRAPAAPALTALPQVQDLPVADHGYDRAKVEEAFDSFRRHVTSLQAQLRVLQAAPRGAASEPTGHAVRMDALHLVRAAAEFADTIERDAQEAAAKQIGRAEQEIREKQMSIQQQRDRGRPHPPGDRAPARRDRERRAHRGARPAREGQPRLLAGAPRGRGLRRPAARAGAPPGDRAHERRPRRGRADARVGARAGGRDRAAGPHGRRAAPLRGRPRRPGDRQGGRRDRGVGPGGRTQPARRPGGVRAGPGRRADRARAAPEAPEPDEPETPAAESTDSDDDEPQAS